VPPRPSGTDSFFDSVRRSGLVRTDQRWIGGVGGGLALRFGIDPLVARGILLVSTLLGGLGLVVYGAGWLLLPEQRDGRIHLQHLLRGHFDVAVLGAGAMLLAGLSMPDTWAPFWANGDSGWWRGLVWLSAAALAVVLVVTAARRRDPGAPPTTTLYPGRGSVPPPAPGSPVPPPMGGPTGTTQAMQTTIPGGTTMDPRSAGTGPLPAADASSATTQVLPTTGAQDVPEGQGAYGRSTGTAGSYGATGTYGGTGSYAGPASYIGPAGAWQGSAGSYGGSGTSPTGYHAPAPRWEGPTTTLPRASRGPGAGVLGIVVAIVLLTLAGLLYADRIGTFTGPVALTTLSVAVILLGLAVLVSGLRGRTSGGLGALAVIGVLVAVPMSAAYTSDWDGTWDASDTTFGDVTETPTTLGEAEAGYSLGAGNARIDLTDLPLGTDEVVVPVRMGAGDLRIVVPADVAYRGEISVMAGDVSWPGERTVSGVRPADEDLMFSSPAVDDGEPAVLVLDVSVGAGNVTVVEEQR
jgi:phage shock protein PspC (stress-responsive transcriptional regulator)